ncbi:MAG: hypothetical protein ACXWCG_04440 [Flavitalea sp.]
MELKQNDLIEQEFAVGCPMAKIDSKKVDSISNKILRFLRKKLKKKYKDARPGRIFHKKTIGLANAELTINKNLPEFLKQGLFREEKSYKAWIRFTNGSPDDEPDIKKAARGMAIKILDVGGFEFLDMDPEGNTQDIILFNNPTFTPGLAELQLAGVKAATAGNLFKSGVAAVPIFLRQLRAGIAFLRFARILTPSVLEEIYYSGTPYSFGSGSAIKWRARPLKTLTSIMPKNPSRNYLRDRLKKDLSDPKEEISFELSIQFCQNPRTEPIDDSTVEWKTKFHPIGTITLPKQNIDTNERQKKSKQLSFCPGHSIKEHAPQGGVNLVRMKVYKILANERLAHTDKSNS